MIQNLFQTCAECKESIFNPICPSCLAREIEAWINENSGRIELLKLKEKLLEAVRAYKKSSLRGGRCIICKKNSDFLCPYCFTKEIFDILKEIKANKELLQDFFIHFNYDFDHKGYYKEAEEMDLLV
ncbi:hypothetical protein HZA33_00065 [Candidatus Pacearchaeota archaeon]|nr:hypothetical protein [Candidatus Pacearchaeota archaeon]